MAVKGPSTSGGSAGLFADINITPLTDIFLVLLIIFMVTTSVTIESAAHVDLPKSRRPYLSTVLLTRVSQSPGIATSVLTNKASPLAS